MWYKYTMEYYSAIRKNEIMPFAAIWIDLETVILSVVRHRKTNIICYHLYVESHFFFSITAGSPEQQSAANARPGQLISERSL